MDMSSGECFSDLEMENNPASIINYCNQMMVSSPQFYGDGFNYNNIPNDTYYDSNNDLLYTTKTTSLEAINLVQSNNHTQDFQPVSSSGSDPQHISGSGWSSYCVSSKAGSSGSHEQLISFGSSDQSEVVNDDVIISNSNKGRVIKAKEEPVNEGLDHDYGTISCSGGLTKKGQNGNNKFGGVSSSSLMCSQEHVLAERRRREKMAQRFHALSALIPGLKKMDKASILADAAKYLKQLEEQVKQLEQQTSTTTVESVVLVNKSRNQRHDDVNDNTSSSDHENGNFKCCVDPLLEIEARASNKNVLLRIHCQKNKGILAKVLHEVDNLNLTTLNSNTMPFGSYALDITIVAQMKEEFSMTMKEVAMHLQQTLGHTTIP